MLGAQKKKDRGDVIVSERGRVCVLVTQRRVRSHTYTRGAFTSVGS